MLPQFAQSTEVKGLKDYRGGEKSLLAAQSLLNAETHDRPMRLVDWTCILRAVSLTFAPIGLL